MDMSADITTVRPGRAGLTIGATLIILGLLAVAVIYSMRPPSDLGDALSMLANGRDKYLEPSRYYLLMAVAGVTAAVGVMVALTSYADQHRRRDLRSR